MSNVEEVYLEFNGKPLGPASTGQAYKATLKENGMFIQCPSWSLFGYRYIGE